MQRIAAPMVGGMVTAPILQMLGVSGATWQELLPMLIRQCEPFVAASHVRALHVEAGFGQN
jgi:hypothetical protein